MDEKPEPEWRSFMVGDVTIEPSLNRFMRGGDSIAVEPKVMDLLVELIRDPGKVRDRADLIDRVWGVSFGRDESLTKAVSGLRHALAHFAPDEKFIDTVSKRGYRLAAPVTFPGNAETVYTVGRSSKHTRALLGHHNRHRLAIANVVILVLVAIFFGFRARPARTEQANSVAIGNFDLINATSSTRASAIALHDSLMKELPLAGVHVVSDSKTTKAPFRVLGSISQVGGKSTASIRVEDGKSHNILWSRQFDVGSEPDRMARLYIPWSVGSTISCGILGNDNGKRLNDSDLVGFFLKACNGFRKGGDFQKMLHYSRQAVTYAPQSTIAKVRYAIAAAWAAHSQTAPGDRKELVNLAEQLAGEAVKTHPRMGVAHYAKGVADWAARDWEGAEQNLREARTLAPDYPYTYNALASLAQDLGRKAEATDLVRRAMEADHFSVIQPMKLAVQLADQGMLPSAYHIIEQKLAPIDTELACSTKFYIDHWWGDAGAALRSLDNSCMRRLLPPGQSDCARAFLNVRLGQGDARAALKVCRKVAASVRLRYLVTLGSVDEAFNIAMTRPIDKGPLPELFYSDMAPLRSTSRFMEIVSRYGLTAAWISTKRWPDFCSDPALSYDCQEAAEKAERSMLDRRNARQDAA